MALDKLKGAKLEVLSFKYFIKQTITLTLNLKPDESDFLKAIKVNSSIAKFVYLGQLVNIICFFVFDNMIVFFYII